MEINRKRYLARVDKPTPHSLAATVDVFREFMGEEDFCKLHDSPENAYKFWLRKCKKCPYSKALEIIKSLESLPIEYNKAGTIINRLKKL